MFRLAHSEYLWMLLLVPVVFILYWAYTRWRKDRLNALADAHLLETIFPDISKRKHIIHFILLSLSMTCFVIALSGPQLGSKLEEAKREGVDLMICLDVSNSMLAEDLVPNRLNRAKRAMEKLVDRLKTDRIGMVVFAGKAFVQLPITTDYAAAKLFIKTTNTSTVGVQGTAIGNAIELATESFDLESPTGKAIIIITDGENHEDNAIEAANTAQEIGIVVHTIGMGSEKGSPIPLYRGKKQIGFKRDPSGNTVVTKLNEDMLAEIADAGNGKFVRATNADAGLDYLFDEIEKMEKAEFGSKIFTDYEDRFRIPLALGFFFLLLDILIGNNKSKWVRSWGIFSVKRS